MVGYFQGIVSFVGCVIECALLHLTLVAVRLLKQFKDPRIRFSVVSGFSLLHRGSFIQYREILTLYNRHHFMSLLLLVFESVFLAGIKCYDFGEFFLLFVI